MIWDHSMQLIIEINNWWLGPSVLPLANTFLSCEISATCNLQAPQRHRGCPIHIQRSTALLLPTHSHTPTGCHTSPEREANEATCAPELFPWLREKRTRAGLGPLASSPTVHSPWQGHLGSLYMVAKWISKIISEIAQHCLVHFGNC